MVKLSFAGWAEGNVLPSVTDVAVVPRKAVSAVAVTPRQRAVWRLEDDWKVNQVVATANDEKLVVASSRSDKSGRTLRVSIRELTTGREVQKLLELPAEKGISHSIQLMELSPDGHWLAVTVFRDGEGHKNGGDVYFNWADRLYLIDLNTAKVAHGIASDGFTIQRLAFSPNNQVLATAQMARVDRRQEGKTVMEFNGDVRVWDIATGKLLSTLSADANQGPTHVVFTPDGKSLAADYSISASDHRRHLTRIWNWRERTVRAELSGRSSPRFMNDSLLLAQSDKGELVLRDLASGRDSSLPFYDYPRNWLMHAQAAADGRSVLCFLNNGRIVVQELPSGKVRVDERDFCAVNSVRKIAWSYAGSRDGQWFAVSGQVAIPPGRVPATTLSEDWEEIAPPEIHVWDAVRLRRLATLTGHVGRVADMAFSAGGRWLVSCGTDRTIRLWDLSDLAR